MSETPAVYATAQPESIRTPRILTATLPLPPSTNHLYGQNGSQRYLLPQVKLFRRAVAERFVLARWPRNVQAEEWRLRYCLYCPTRKNAPGHRDVDNVQKILIDAIAHWIDLDDARLVEVHGCVYPVLPDDALVTVTVTV